MRFRRTKENGYKTNNVIPNLIIKEVGGLGNEVKGN